MAIYLIHPTAANFDLLTEDLSEQRYDNYYINFLDLLPESSIQTFFSHILKQETNNRIYKISVHPLNFRPVHDKVFDLAIPRPYSLLSSPLTKEEEALSYFSTSGDRLFSVLFSLRLIPLVKYKPNDITTPIIEKIQANFKTLFEKFPELKEEFNYSQNAFLTVLERENDLPIMFHHSASFGSMMNDLFGLSTQQHKKAFPLDPEVDYIWQDCIAMDFPSVHEKITADLGELQAKTKFLNEDNLEGTEEINEKLASTLEGLRDLTLRQKTLETHCNFASLLKEEIEGRQLDVIYDFEYNFLSKKKMNKEIKEKYDRVIKQATAKTRDDLLRTLAIRILLDRQATKEVIESELKKCGLESKAMAYLLDKVADTKPTETEVKHGLFSYLKAGHSVVMDRLSQFISTEQPSLMADLVVDAVKRTNKEYVCYDLLKKKQVEQKNDCSEMIVYVYGGGSLAEFECLEQKMNGLNKTLLYGSDKIYRPVEFLEELEMLGSESG